MDLTLDSLEEGKHYRDIIAGGSPGADITAALQVSVVGREAASWRDAADSISTSSLFASDSLDNDPKTIRVAAFRHLQNLEGSVSGLPEDAALELSVTQTEHIDCSASGIEGFLPIENPGIRRFDGAGFEIANLTVATEGSAGLFARFTGGDTAVLSGIRLRDPQITGGTSAGALAGEIDGDVFISDCRVFDTPGVFRENGGIADSDFTPAAGPPEAEITAAAGPAGGLAGWAFGDVAIHRSFTAVSLRGDSCAGGLLGGTEGALAVSDSYAACCLGGETVGGLAGQAGSASMINCYSAGFLLDRVETAAGLIAEAGSGAWLRRCLSLFNYDNVFDAAVFHSGSISFEEALPGGAGVSRYPREGRRRLAERVYTLVRCGAVDADGCYYTYGGAVSGTEGGAYRSARDLLETEGIVPAEQLFSYGEPPVLREMEPELARPVVCLEDGPHYGDWLERPAEEHCALVNDEVLYARLLLEDLEQAYTLVFTGGDSGAVQALLLEYDGARWSVTGSAVSTVDSDAPWQYSDPGADWRSSSASNGDGITVFCLLLDDITAPGCHFHELFPAFLPGETLSLRAVTGIQTELAQALSAEAVSANSLFAAKKEENRNTAVIGCVRHLQNLDTAVSGVNAGDTAFVTAAVLEPGNGEKQIVWSQLREGRNRVYREEFGWETEDSLRIYACGERERFAENSFFGIENTGLRRFFGAAEDENGAMLPGVSLVGFCIDSGRQNIASSGHAGLFRRVGEQLTVENVWLRDVQVSAASDRGNAGAFAGSLEGEGASLLLRGCLAAAKPGGTPEQIAFARVISESGNAGGLVGCVGQGAGLCIESSASTLLVRGGIHAGGLVGCILGNPYGSFEQESRIEDSFVGGHTADTVFGSRYLPEDGQETVWNVEAASGAAGGLIGRIDRASLRCVRSFSAASVRGGSAAGGILGQADSFSASQLTLQSVYTVGPVEGAASEEELSRGSFAGIVNGGIGADSASLFVLPDVYGEAAAGGLLRGTKTDDAADSLIRMISFSPEEAAADQPLGETLSMPEPGDTLAAHTFPYAGSLAGEDYPFSVWTVFNLAGQETGDGRSYYGDWQPPTKSDAG